MGANLFDQPWFIEAVKPTADELAYLGEHAQDFIKRVETFQNQGMTGQNASVRAAKEMLGKE